MGEFQIGDLVRIVGPSDHHSRACYVVGFNEQMEDLLGTEGEIVNIVNGIGGEFTGYILSGHGWKYVSEWLEMVSEPQIVTDEEFENVFK